MKINWKRTLGITIRAFYVCLFCLLAYRGLCACGHSDGYLRKINATSLEIPASASDLASADVVFGEVKSHYTTNQILRWSITNNGKEDLRYYCTVEAKEQDRWREVDYSLEGDELSREKVTEMLPLRAGETKRRIWSLSKDADRMKYMLATTKRYRLKASFYVASGPLGPAIASAVSPEFEVTPAPAAASPSKQ